MCYQMMSLATLSQNAVPSALSKGLYHFPGGTASISICNLFLAKLGCGKVDVKCEYMSKRDFGGGEGGGVICSVFNISYLIVQ